MRFFEVGVGDKMVLLRKCVGLFWFRFQFWFRCSLGLQVGPLQALWFRLARRKCQPLADKPHLKIIPSAVTPSAVMLSAVDQSQNRNKKGPLKG